MDIFRLRRIHNDASIIDEIVDEEFARKNSLFVFGKNGRTGRTEVMERDWHAVKERLLLDLAWAACRRSKSSTRITKAAANC